jgi:hypothetical protein
MNVKNTNAIHKNISQIESRRTRGGKGLHSRNNLWFLHKSSICGPLSQETLREGKLGKEERENERGEGDGGFLILFNRAITQSQFCP